MQLTAFFSSALGKAVKVALFVGVSAAVVAFSKGGLSPREVGTIGLVAAFNSILVFLQGALDPATPTVPGSSVAPPVALADLKPKAKSKK